MIILEFVTKKRRIFENNYSFDQYHLKIIIHHRYKSFKSVLKIFKMDLADSGNKLYI